MSTTLCDVRHVAPYKNVSFLTYLLISLPETRQSTAFRIICLLWGLHWRSNYLNESKIRMSLRYHSFIRVTRIIVQEC